MRRIIISILALVTLPGMSLQAETHWEKAVLLSTNGYSVRAEYREYAGKYFIRNGRTGRLFDSSIILDTVSESYYRKVSTSSPLTAVRDSLLYFNSGAGYRWDKTGAKNLRKDKIVRYAKIAMLGITAYAYNNAAHQNKRLSNSTFLLNDGAARNRFRGARQAFNVSSAVTALYFAYTFIDAYWNFGRNIKGVYLGIDTRKEIPLETLIQAASINAGAEKPLEVSWSLNF